MQVTSSWLHEDIGEEKEAIVVVDVWVCTTNINIILASSPKSLYLTSEKYLNDLQNELSNAISVGQVRNKKLILNVSNEPADVSKINFVDKNVILTTFNGVKAFQKAVKSSKNVFSCSISNIDTISEFIKNRYKNLHILKAGENSNTNIEDEEISSWIEALVNDNSIDLKYKKINLEKRLLAYPPYHFLEKERQDYFPYLFSDQYDIVPFVVNQNENYIQISNFS